MELQERIASHLAEHKFGCTARELSKAIGERLDLVQEHLLVMAAMSTVKSRLVGRDQVYVLVTGKVVVPTPRELLAQAQAVVDAAPAPVAEKPKAERAARVKPVSEAAPAVDRKPEPMPSPDVAEPVPVTPRKREHTGEIKAMLQQRRAKRAEFVASTCIDFKALVADGFDANSGTPKRPSMYDRVGGSITLDLFGKPITARFTSVEQLKKFVDDLIEAGRAPEKG